MTASRDYSTAPVRHAYSYDRPSSIVWNATINALMDAGYSESEAFAYVCSKATRWALDGNLGDEIYRAAYDYAKADAAAWHDTVRDTAP